MPERIVPFDLAAEKAVLGAVLVDNALLATVVPLLASKDFFRSAHRSIYEHMVKLGEKHAPIDPITLADVLVASGELDEVGGVGYIMSMTDGVPRSSNVESYAKIVRGHSMRRKIIQTAQDLMAGAYDTENEVSELTDKAGSDLYALSQERTHGQLEPMRDIVTSTLAIIERNANSDQKILGLETGFTKLDKLLGGLRGGQFIVVAARPSMGKTSWVTNVAQHIGSMGKSVAFFSLEMSKQELCFRMLSSESRVSSSRMMRGSLEEAEWSRVATASGIVSESMVFVDDTADLGVFELHAKARAMKASKSGLDLIIIDYLQLMPGDHRLDNRQAEVSAISRSCKLLSKELDIPVIALSQLSRKNEERTNKRPMLSDLRESGALEQDADVVLFIHREEVYKATDANHGKAEIIIGKQRNGPTTSVVLNWVNEHTRFENTTAGEMYDR